MEIMKTCPPTHHYLLSTVSKHFDCIHSPGRAFLIFLVNNYFKQYSKKIEGSDTFRKPTFEQENKPRPS